MFEKQAYLRLLGLALASQSKQSKYQEHVVKRKASGWGCRPEAGNIEKRKNYANFSCTRNTIVYINIH